ncbi:MAG: J domain-containing protein [Clostridiales bacterium]|nr:J domain-containing protein [Clostridiales bacterium]
MDPYEVLGVPRDADDETIKKAYRSLIKKYHPDKYINTPMADMASEKTKEINKAYDMITGKNQNTGSGQSGGYYNPFGGYARSSANMPPSFRSVRILLSTGQTAAAERMLSGLDKNSAEWYYLYGIVCLRKGWYDQAISNLNRACEMEPGNTEYRDALNNIQNGNRRYTDTVHTNMGTDMCCDCPMPCICWIPCLGCSPCTCC